MLERKGYLKMKIMSSMMTIEQHQHTTTTNQSLVNSNMEKTHKLIGSAVPSIT
jgi:hypothetical protein